MPNSRGPSGVCSPPSGPAWQHHGVTVPLFTVCLVFVLFFCFFNSSCSCSQHLEFPRGRLILVIQAIGIEVELPRRRLVLIIQAVRRGVEAQAGRPVALAGQGRRGLVQVARHRVRAHRAEGGAGPRQLVVHRGEVRAAVHAAEVRRRASVALAVAGRLRVRHGVGALHARRRGRQGVRERRDGGRAPDGHRRGAGGDGRDRGGAGGGRELAAGAALGAHLPARGALLLGGTHLVLAAVLLLLLLLAALGPSVLEPHLKRRETRLKTTISSSFFFFSSCCTFEVCIRPLACSHQAGQLHTIKHLHQPLTSLTNT